MFCGSCGKQNDDSAKFCVHCGASANGFASSRIGGGSEISEPVSLTITGPVNLSFGANEHGAASQTCCDYLVPNILELLCCCCFPTAIVGLAFSVASRCAKSRGDWRKARDRAIVAKTLFWVTPFIVIFLLLTSGSYNATVTKSFSCGDKTTETTKVSKKFDMKNLFDQAEVKEALSELGDAFASVGREMKKAADEIADQGKKPADDQESDDDPETIEIAPPPVPFQKLPQFDSDEEDSILEDPETLIREFDSSDDVPDVLPDEEERESDEDEDDDPFLNMDRDDDPPGV